MQPIKTALPVKNSLTIARWAVAIGAAALLFFQLGSRGLNEPDEGRYAGIGWEMLASGQWLTPHLNGTLHLSKPPLTYWLIAASMSVFGPNEFAARLPSALAGLATLLAAYLLVRQTWEERAALWAAGILATSLFFFGGSRLITADMLLTCCVTWSVWSFWRWYTAQRRSWRAIAPFYVWLALGMLTKGPVAVLLVLGAVAGARWHNPALRLRTMSWGRGALLFLAVAAPWFVTVAIQTPELWKYFLRESIGRFATSVHQRTEPWWFFFAVLPVAFLPWTALLPAAATGLQRQTEPARTAVRLLVSWVGLGLLLFTLSRSKLPTYVFPLLPPLAMLSAAVLTAEKANFVERWWWKATPVTWALLAGLSAALSVVAYLRYGIAIGTLAPLWCIVAAGIAAALLAWMHHGWRTALAMTILTTALAEATIAMVAPQVEQHLGSKAPAKYLAERLRQADPDARRPIVFVHSKPPRGLPFYLRRFVLQYRPSAAADEIGVFEFGAATHAPNVITDPAAFRALLSSSAGAIVVTPASAVAALQEAEPSLIAIAKVNQWVLLSNAVSAKQ